MLIGIDASRASIAQKTGVEYYSASLIEWLAKVDNFLIRSGKENNYLLYTPAALEGDLANLPSNFKEIVIPFSRMWTHIRLSFELMLRPPDLLFVPAHVLPVIHPKKTVITIHDVAFNYFPEAYSDRARNYLEWSTKYAVRHATKIIAISESTKKDLIKFYKARPEQVQVIHNGYDDLFLAFNPDKKIYESILRRMKIERDYLLFIGRIEKKKNVINIIRAYELVREGGFDCQLVLAGKLGFGSIDILRAIEKSRYGDDIILPGYVSEEDSMYLMHGTKVFVFPTLYEGFGLPVVEAMASGTPVVSSNRSSIPEVAGDAALLVDPLRYQEIAKAICRILIDDDLRISLIKKGKVRVKEFSWEKCAEQTLKLLESL